MEQEYQKLEQNLIDLIKEEQMKLGYRNGLEGIQNIWEMLQYLTKKTVSVSVFRQKGQSMYMSRCRTIHF